jgi:hypothetical protein
MLNKVGQEISQAVCSERGCDGAGEEATTGNSFRAFGGAEL